MPFIAYELWDGATHNLIEYTEDWDEVKKWVEWIAVEWPAGCLEDVGCGLYLYGEHVETRYGWDILRLGT